MTRPVRRDEIIDFQTYEDGRDAFRATVLEAKRPRRIHLGDVLTFLFENTLTTRYQIQEMVRVEKIVREASIQHEIDTYNGLLGGPGELGCSLLIELEDTPERPEKLRRWLELPKTLYMKLEDGTKVAATYDPTQVGEDRLSAVQYLKFAVGDGVPVAIGTTLDELSGEVELSEAQRTALLADLRED